MFRQDPGDDNSLGIVKINFPSPEGVYMHDTPHKGTVQRRLPLRFVGLRARPEHPRADRRGSARHARLDARRDRRRSCAATTRLDVKVTNPVPLYWAYITAWATTDGVVNFRDDIYNLDGLDVTADAAGATASRLPPRTARLPTPERPLQPLLPPQNRTSRTRQAAVWRSARL